MSLLTKLASEGWWDRTTRKEAKIRADQFTVENIRELSQSRKTLVRDEKARKTYLVTIRQDAEFEQICGDDFEIVEEPK